MRQESSQIASVFSGMFHVNPDGDPRLHQPTGEQRARQAQQQPARHIGRSGRERGDRWRQVAPGEQVALAVGRRLAPGIDADGQHEDEIERERNEDAGLHGRGVSDRDAGWLGPRATEGMSHLSHCPGERMSPCADSVALCVGRVTLAGEGVSLLGEGVALQMRAP